mgnify:CR=1 FL=1
MRKRIYPKYTNRKANLCQKNKKEDAFLNWDMNVRAMFNMIRALHLWPVARINLFGDNIKILDANCIEKNTNIQLVL